MDLGDNPVGVPPTPQEQSQIRKSIGVDQSPILTVDSALTDIAQLTEVDGFDSNFKAIIDANGVGEITNIGALGANDYVIPWTPFPSKITISSGFEYNGSPTGVHIPNSVISIEITAFSDCSGLTGDLTIPDSVTVIGESAFYSCTGLDGTLTLGNSVTSIGQNAFYSCSQFTGDLVIPDSVETISSFAFNYAFDLSNTGTLTLPNNIAFTEISSNAFYYAGLRGDLNIPDTVLVLREQSFTNSKFDGLVTIPDSVTDIESLVFAGMTVSRIEIHANPAPTINSAAFYYTTTTDGNLIHVPVGATV